jgi:hypothetical protein
MNELIPITDIPTHLVDAAAFEGEWCKPNALHLPGGLPPVQWLGIGEFIEATAEWTPFARGYWWLYGEREYGEPRRTQLLEWVRQTYPDSALARKRKTYVNYARVIRAFDPVPTPGRCLEYENFWWYDAALGLPEEEREVFLETCAKHNLSSRQARALANGWYDLEKVDEKEVASLMSQNGRLRETAHDLHTTVDVLRDEVEELTARNHYLEQAITAREERLAQARHSDEATEDGGEDWDYEQGADRNTVTCPKCGAIIEL